MQLQRILGEIVIHTSPAIAAAGAVPPPSPAIVASASAIPPAASNPTPAESKVEAEGDTTDSSEPDSPAASPLAPPQANLFTVQFDGSVCTAAPLTFVSV